MDAALAEIRAQRHASDPLDSALAEIRAAKTPEKPGVLSRAMDSIGGAVSHAIEHPIDTIESAVVAPIKSAFTAAVAPGVGEARPDARLSKGGNSSGRPIDTSAYDAEHGGVTNKERTAAGIQTAANIATPAAFGPLAGKIGKTGALAATGAVEGAAYNPDDPGAGAIAGGFLAPVVGGIARGSAKATDATRQVVGKTQRIRAAEPLDKNAIADTKATDAATAENYGRAKSEAQANGGTSPAVQNALADPKIKDYVSEVREELGATATDAEALAEVRVRVSQDKRGYQKAAAAASVNGKYDPKMARTIKGLQGALKRLDAAMAAPSTKPAITMDIAPEVFETAPSVTQPGREPAAGPITPGLARDVTSAPNPSLSQALRNFTGDRENAVQGPKGPAFQLAGQAEKVTPGVRVETPGMRVQTAPEEAVGPLAPSYPRAVSEHARMKGNRAAFNTGADATKRIMRGTSVAANKLDTQSPAAFLEEILGMSPEQAQAALEGTLGRAKELSPPLLKSLTPELKKGFGVGQNVARVGRIAPFIDALDKQAGKPTFSPIDLEEALKYLGGATAPSPNRTP